MERVRSILAQLAGALLLAAALLLSLPGIQVARAGSEADPVEFDRFLSHVGEAPAPRDASECQAGQGMANADLRARRVLEQLQRQARAAAPAPSGPPEIRVLNGRGYNYGAQQGPAADLGQLQRELMRRHSPSPSS